MKSLSLESFTTFGDLLRYLRQRERLTQRELSIAVGYSESQINRLEHNLRLPEPSIIAAQFIPALRLEEEPVAAARLIELAAEARGEPMPTSFTFARSTRRAATDENGIPLRKRRSNLPAQMTSFVGREDEIAELVTRAKTTRLFTLTGAGGVGKTRLALEVASRVEDDFRDGVWLVEFASLSDESLVPHAVANVFGLVDQPSVSPADVLTNYFASKHLLLILDNCEHLIEACARLADRLLRDCPNVHLLTTSREPLRITGEVVHRVPSLSCPDPQHLPSAPSVEKLLEYEAVQLFVDRATAAASSFEVTQKNAVPLAQVCQQLDGIPLAIELAAARVSVMQVEQIAARLDDRFHLLTGGSRAALPRHKTLRALIDWSYDLLTEAEQTMLRRLSVFAGGWTLEMAEVVVGEAISDALDVLTQLVNKSLVTVERGNAAQVRYRMLETIRQYAHERLLERDEEERTRDQHLKYFLQLAEQAEPELNRADQVAWLNRLEAELDNFRAALEWSLEGERYVEAGLRLAAALMWFWLIRGHRREGGDWLEWALSIEACTRGAEPPSQARVLARTNALNAAGFLMGMQGNLAKSVALSEEALALSRDLGHLGKWSTAMALCNLGDVAYEQQNYGQAQMLFEESRAFFQENGDKLGVAGCLSALGGIMLNTGDNKRARAFHEESLVL